MEFPGVPDKEHVEIPGGQLRKEVEIPGDMNKKSFGIFMGLVLVFDLGISKGCHTNLYQEFPGVKAYFIWNFQG